MWSLDLSLRRIRDCGALAAVLGRADTADRRWLGRQLAGVLAALPHAQAELAAQTLHTRLPALQELVRQAGMLETVALDLAQHPQASGAQGLQAESGHGLLKASKG